MKKVLVFLLFLLICVQSFATVKEINLSNVKVYWLKEGVLFNSPFRLPQPIKTLDFMTIDPSWKINFIEHVPSPNVATVVSYRYSSGYTTYGTLACTLGFTTITRNLNQTTSPNFGGSFVFTGVPVQPNVEQRMVWSHNGGTQYVKFIWHGTGVGPACTVTCQPGECSF